MKPLLAVLLTLTAGLAFGAAPALAAPAATPCRLPGFVAGDAGSPCPSPQPVADVSIDLWPFGGLIGSAARSVLHTVESWVLDGAAGALRSTASLMNTTTEPALTSTWFSATYWRVAAVSAVLTLPFLLAAAIHALVRSDIGLLARAAFGYLPLAMLGVSIAAPFTMLLLGATNEMSDYVAGAASSGAPAFLARCATAITGAAFVQADPFVAFFVALLTVMAVIALWIELLIRDAAVDVVVLMLPLFFAAMVWPARRTWAIRAIETLFALILSKFAIVAVLSLGGAALEHLDSGPAALLTGVTLILLATASPWALLRLLPLHEVAAAAAGGLSREPRAAIASGIRAAGSGADFAAHLGGIGGGHDDTPDPLGNDDGGATATQRLLAIGPSSARGSGRPAGGGGSDGDGEKGADDSLTTIRDAGPGSGGGGGGGAPRIPLAALMPRGSDGDGDSGGGDGRGGAGGGGRGPMPGWAQSGSYGEEQEVVLGDTAEERMQLPRVSGRDDGDAAGASAVSPQAAEEPPRLDDPPRLPEPPARFVPTTTPPPAGDDDDDGEA